MIRQITNIAKVSEILAKGGETRFNSTLPVSIEVLKKVSGQFEGLRYLLQIGSKQVETQSANPLMEGKRYWGDMKQDKEGNTVLSHLSLKPKLFQREGEKTFDTLPKFSYESLATLSESPKSIETLKTSYLEHLAEAQTPTQFTVLQNVALGFEHGIATLVIDEEEKQSLVQFRTKAIKGTVEFYALFPHLGAMKGTVLLAPDEKVGLSLTVEQPKVKHFLDEAKEFLQGVDALSITIGKTGEALWNIDSQLLNIRG